MLAKLAACLAGLDRRYAAGEVPDAVARWVELGRTAGVGRDSIAALARRCFDDGSPRA